jgi:hypothetical protein
MTSLSCLRQRSAGFVFAVAVTATLVVASAGCPRKKAGDAPVSVPKSCASNQDCDDGWACLAARCYDTRKSAVFNHPEQMVTPDRVRQEVEHQQDQHLRRMEKDLQGADVPAGAN